MSRSIGIVGGGQLGRMLALAAHPLGLEVRSLDPDPQAPIQAVVHDHVVASYSDVAALKMLAESVDMLLIEFENLDAESLQAVQTICPIHPSPEVLHICQNRLREKTFLKERGIPHAPFRYIESVEEVRQAFAELGGEVVLKTAGFGYDGKGQAVLRSAEDLAKVGALLEEGPCVMEQWIRFQAEYSVIIARRAGGEVESFPVICNRHRNNILDVSVAPALDLNEEQERAAQLIARQCAEDLGVIGLLTVEFFLTESGEWLVNEMAPRPHNSGHFSIDSAPSSQFEQYLRAALDWPLGSPKIRGVGAMQNLLGELWERDMDWPGLLSDPRLKLHLYGKQEARSGRKMGHINIIGEDAGEVLGSLTALRKKLGLPNDIPWSF